MEEIMAAGIGDKLNLVGFFFTLVGLLAAFVGAVLMFLGSSITGDSIWQSLRKIQGVAEQASVVAPAQWTPAVKVDLSAFVPPTAIQAQLAYTMHASDTRIPLAITLSTAEFGGLLGHGAGAQGIISMMLDGEPHLYVSLSHPDVTWSLAVAGWKSR